MKITRTLLGAAMLFAVLGLAACGGSGDSNTAAAAPDAKAAPIVFKMGHTLAVTGHYEAGCRRYSDLLKERTNGQIVVETYPGSVLGGERDMFEALQLGTQDLLLSTTAPIGAFLPEMMIFDLPFLFRTIEECWAVADGEVGTQILKNLENIKVIGFAYWENGLRHIYSNFPVQKPADLKGKKIRVMQNNVHTRSFETMGAMPTAMAYSEVFTAMQQGTVDGGEGSISGIIADKYYEAASTFSLTAHFASPVPVMMSKAIFEKQTPEHQKLLRDTAIEVRDWQRQYALDGEAKYLEEARSNGMKIIEASEIDRAAFEALCRPLYKEFYSTIPEALINSILSKG